MKYNYGENIDQAGDRGAQESRSEMMGAVETEIEPEVLRGILYNIANDIPLTDEQQEALDTFKKNHEEYHH